MCEIYSKLTIKALEWRQYVALVSLLLILNVQISLWCFRYWLWTSNASWIWTDLVLDSDFFTEKDSTKISTKWLIFTSYTFPGKLMNQLWPKPTLKETWWFEVLLNSWSLLWINLTFHPLKRAPLHFIINGFITMGATMVIEENICVKYTLHKKWSFSLRIHSVNGTKSAVPRGFGHAYWR